MWIPGKKKESVHHEKRQGSRFLPNPDQPEPKLIIPNSPEVFQLVRVEDQFIIISIQFAQIFIFESLNGKRQKEE